MALNQLADGLREELSGTFAAMADYLQVFTPGCLGENVKFW